MAAQIFAGQSALATATATLKRQGDQLGNQSEELEGLRDSLSKRETEIESLLAELESASGLNSEKQSQITSLGEQLSGVQSSLVLVRGELG